jgi:hypothetical protein
VTCAPSLRVKTAEEFRSSWDKVLTRSEDGWTTLSRDKVCVVLCLWSAVAYLVAWGLEHRVLGAIRAIGVDEIQYGKGHKYLTLVYRIDLGCTRLLWIGKERTDPERSTKPTLSDDKRNHASSFGPEPSESSLP